MNKKISVFLMILILMNVLGLMLASADSPGKYTMFAVRRDGSYVDSSSLGLSSSMTLNDDGKGSMEFDSDSIAITSWTIADSIIAIHTADGGSANGEMKEGIIELDVNGDGSYLICYALPETDLSEYTIISLDEFQALQDTSAQTAKP